MLSGSLIQRVRALLLAALFALATVSLGPVACNTAKGFGEDLESAGQGLQDEIDEEETDDEWEDDFDD